jgi:hypothetical protein
MPAPVNHPEDENVSEVDCLSQTNLASNAKKNYRNHILEK